MVWIPRHILVLLEITIVSYIIALLLERIENQSMKKGILGIGILNALGILICLKYLPFFMSTYNEIGLGHPVDLGRFDWIVPVGLSFFSLQAVGYMIDIYRGDYKAETDIISFALFMSFFPQMAAGPIGRGKTLLPQLKNLSKRISDVQLKEGLYSMLIGYFKKIALADVLAIYINGVYADLSGMTGLSVLLAVLLYSLLIYFDFSGYSDIALGCAKLLGIDLIVNFNVPYASASFKEFWGRWHVSLSSWFRDYVYFPLGGGRKGKIRKYINVVIIFLLSGLWHGTAWTFVIWGIIHGIYRVIEEITPLASINNKNIKKCITFLLISFAWIFFRSETLGQALEVIRGLDNSWSVDRFIMDFHIILSNGVFASITFDIFYVITSVLSLIIIFLIDKRKAERNSGNSDSMNFSKGKPLVIFYIVIITIFYFILQNGSFIQTGQFIYFEF